MTRPGSVFSLSAPGPFRTDLAAAVGAALFCLGLYGLTATVHAQAQPQVQAQPQAQPQARPTLPAGTSATLANSSKATPAGSRSNGKRVTKPSWSQLTPAQQQALAPLSAKWDTVSETQKRKWLALSRNFPGMSGAEQDKLHSRMSEWAALSPQQRTQARLNFGQTQQLSPDDKKAKWEAYQALPLEEKRKLAARAAKPPATAAAVKPVPPEKLAHGPKARRPNKLPPRIAASGQVDRNTLLPQPSPAPAPAPAAVRTTN